MRVKYLVTLGLALVFAVGFGGQRAYADSLNLRYSVNGGSWITVADSDDGDLDGFILLNANPGVWTALMQIGMGGANSNDPSFPLPNLTLNLNSMAATVASGGSGTLEIQLSQTDLTPSASGWKATWAPVFAGSDGSVGSNLTAEMTAYADVSNASFGTTQLLKSFGPLGSGSYSDSGAANLATPYSLTLDVKYTANNTNPGSAGMTGAAQVELVPTPEPNALFMLGIGLALLGGCARFSPRGRHIA